jgi:periplasmic divalent cation tolerance protein
VTAAEQVAPAVVLTTVGSREAADSIADTVLERRLAACVQLLTIDSTYRWKGEIVREPEILLMIKTSTGRYAELETAIDEVHPYEVPEILLLPVEAGLPAYLGWIIANTS